MGNIVKAAVAIRGVRPLFWHRFGPDAMPLEKEERTGVAGHDPEEWRKTVLVTKEGQLYLDPSQVFASLRDGSKYIKRGRASIQPFLVATLQVTDDRVLVDRFFPGFPNGVDIDLKSIPPPSESLDEPLHLDIRGAVNPSTKARNIRYRIVASPGWNAKFNLLWDKTVVAREQMQSILLEAGRLVGIGNARKIGMGRFEVVSCEIEEA